MSQFAAELMHKLNQANLNAILLLGIIVIFRYLRGMFVPGS